VEECLQQYRLSLLPVAPAHTSRVAVLPYFGVPIRGRGKGKVHYMAPDFDDPIEDSDGRYHGPRIGSSACR